jgi:tripartite-type tricarboxylate transporter receptor subunit TctC
MVLNRRQAIGVGLAAMAGVCIATPGLAEDYPSKPIRLIVVTAAGGLMDVAARVTAENLAKSLGQPVVVENRPGVGGNLGTEAVAKATPDGYTIGLIQLGNVAINPYVYKDLGFDPVNDLTPVAPVTTSAILVVANAKVPANTLQELIALAKREPGKISYGSGGAGTVPHLAGEMFRIAAGINILHVPYRGVGPAVNDMAGGHIQLAFAGWGAVRAPVEAKLARVLAVAQPKRLVAAPQFPTTAEAGLPTFEFSTWFGIVAPKGTPPAIVNELAQHIHAMQDKPEVQRTLIDGGLEVLKESPEEFAARIGREHNRMRDVVKGAGLKQQ